MCIVSAVPLSGYIKEFSGYRKELKLLQWYLRWNKDLLELFLLMCYGAGPVLYTEMSGDFLGMGLEDSKSPWSCPFSVMRTLSPFPQASFYSNISFYIQKFSYLLGVREISIT